MQSRNIAVAAYAIVFGLLAPAACNSNDTNLDPTTVADAGLAADSAPRADNKLYRCETPGKACNAHDPCAINPICGEDRWCRPSGFQDCDDDLPCTIDICAGLGRCEHKPADGTCALPVRSGDGKATVVRCFEAKQTSPDEACLICDPERATSQWSPANGGGCDDGDDCTSDDYCNDGECTGVNYRSRCDDGFGCTEDLCDGKGGCLGHELKGGFCLINGKCHSDEQRRDGGDCEVCNASKSPTSWSPLQSSCISTVKLDGELDKGAILVAGQADKKPIYLAVSGQKLYLATRAAADGQDTFILVSKVPPSGKQDPPWAKGGHVPMKVNAVFLAGESDSDYAGWFSLSPPSLLRDKPFSGHYAFSLANKKGGFLEGTIDFSRYWQPAPAHVYVAVGAWKTDDGGTLSQQTPASKDGNHDIDPSEVLKVEFPSLKVVSK